MRTNDMKICTENDCQGKVIARGLCQKHYMQQRRGGLFEPIYSVDDGQYLASRIRIDSNGCWIWQQSKREGYGRIVRHGRTWQAHVFSYVTHIGEVPLGLQINHKCHVRACVNPEHLYAGSQQQNMQDMKDAGRDNYLVGEADGNSRINAEVAKQIFSHSGIAREAAEKFGVSVSLVYAIKKKQVWRHLHE